MQPTIILASASPRRQALMRDLGLSFAIQTADIDETPYPSEAPTALALRLAETKARTVDMRYSADEADALIIASDTVVALADQLLGKPSDAADATRMLRLLRGRRHQVHTAICLLSTATDGAEMRLNTTTVLMRDYDDAAIAAYVATGDPLDKAGAYAIQHPDFAPVAALTGCFSGVMGFPLGDLCDLLAGAGVVVETQLPSVCEMHTHFTCCRG